MATTNFTFTTFTGSETAGWNSINTIINSIDTQLYAKASGLASGGSSGQVLTWSGTSWIAGTVGASGIDNNAVALGTKTTGDYVASISAAGVDEVAVTGSGESAAATVRLANNTALRGAATVATPPTYTDGQTGDSNRIPDALYVTTALAYATSGNVTLAGDVGGSAAANTIGVGKVTSSNILNGTIVNEDINASANIDKTKISGTAITAADTGTVTSTMINNGTIVLDDLAQAVKDYLMPTGTVVPFMGRAIDKPATWYVCDGSSFASNGLTAGMPLYTLLVAAGWSALPDLRGRSLFGLAGAGSALYSSLQSNEGTATHTSRTTSHSHTIADHAHNAGGLFAMFTVGGSVAYWQEKSTSGWTTTERAGLGNVGDSNTLYEGLNIGGATQGSGSLGTDSKSNVPYAVTNYIIKG